MSKYNADLVLDNGTSFAKIITMIRKKSLILEFGPANGRCTKYLKENMGCDVHIVEINKEDFNEAMQYASDGLCSDIETMEWQEYFKGNTYDHIIFTDVLEHLRNPQKIFNACADFIKDDGSLLFSIPNAAHGDIIANIYNNDFKYTELGLLDNTHIHLFAYKNIMEMIEKSQLKLTKLDMVNAPLKHTEQNSVYDSDILYYVINEKTFANVYQFIGECKKKSDNIPDNSMLLGDRSANQKNVEVYYGHNICKLKELRHKKQNNYECIIDDIPVNIKNIRIDPTSDKLCLIENISIKESVDYIIKHNGIQIGDKIYFFTFDPQIYIESKCRQITLKFNMKEYSILECFIFMNDYICDMDRILKDAYGKITQNENDKKILIEQINKIEEDKNTLFNHIDRLENDKVSLLEKNNQNENEKQTLLKHIDRLENDKAFLLEKNNQNENEKQILSKHIDRLENDKIFILATLKQKEKENILLGEEIKVKEQENQLFRTQLDNIVNEYNIIKNELTSVLNSHSWKITKPLRWLIRKLRFSR